MKSQPLIQLILLAFGLCLLSACSNDDPVITDGDTEVTETDVETPIPDGDSDPDLDEEVELSENVESAEEVENFEITESDNAESVEEDIVEHDAELETVKVEVRLIVSSLSPATLRYDNKEHIVPKVEPVNPGDIPYPVIEVPKNSSFEFVLDSQAWITNVIPGLTENDDFSFDPPNVVNYIPSDLAQELGFEADTQKGMIKIGFSYISQGSACAIGCSASVDVSYGACYATRDGQTQLGCYITPRNSYIEFANVEPGPVNVTVETWAGAGMQCRLRAGGEYRENPVIPVMVYPGSATVLDMDCIGCTEVDGDE